MYFKLVQPCTFRLINLLEEQSSIFKFVNDRILVKLAIPLLLTCKETTAFASLNCISPSLFVSASASPMPSAFVSTLLSLTKVYLKFLSGISTFWAIIAVCKHKPKNIKSRRFFRFFMLKNLD